MMERYPGLSIGPRSPQGPLELEDRGRIVDVKVMQCEKNSTWGGVEVEEGIRGINSNGKNTIKINYF